MSKKRSIYDLTGVDPTAEVSKYCTKNGKLKGSKKQVRALKSICGHHLLNKKGKTKPRIHEEGNKNCQCDICKERFRTRFYNDQELDRSWNPAREVVSQAKFMVVATNGGKETTQDVMELALRMDGFKKTYKNLRKIAEKKDKLSKKRNKKQQKERMGGWRMR